MIVPEMLEIKPLARRDGEPAFEDAWQAELLALAYALSDKGVFTPTEWSEALGAELRQASARGEPDDQNTFYGAALSALERLILRDGRVTVEALAGAPNSGAALTSIRPTGSQSSYRPVRVMQAHRLDRDHRHLPRSAAPNNELPPFGRAPPALVARAWVYTSIDYRSWRGSPAPAHLMERTRAALPAIVLGTTGPRAGNNGSRPVDRRRDL